MALKDIVASDYITKGKQAKSEGKPRNSNPYNMQSEKGHLWDEGWLSSKPRSARAMLNERFDNLDNPVRSAII